MSQEMPKTDEEHIRMQLYALLIEELTFHVIEDSDVMLLSLRLGLLDGKCRTLAETGEVLRMSAERIRQRQYLLVRRRMKNTQFLTLLQAYARYRKLPPGFETIS
jgi:DNA-directed RNA polymerase sigma subunit (sigma70/sigma32)